MLLVLFDTSATIACHACDPSSDMCTDIVLRDIKRDCLQNKNVLHLPKYYRATSHTSSFVVATNVTSASYTHVSYHQLYFFKLKKLAIFYAYSDDLYRLHVKHVLDAPVPGRCIHAKTNSSHGRDSSNKGSGDSSC